VHKTLQAITSPSLFQSLGTDWNWDGDSLTKANGFLFQLESSSFLVCFKVLLEVLSCLRGLTLKLQMEDIDVLYAYEEVRTVVSTLKSMRSDSEKVFKRIYAATTKLGKDLHGDDFELKPPRISGRQTHRNNLQADTPEQYYRTTFFNEIHPFPMNMTHEQNLTSLGIFRAGNFSTIVDTGGISDFTQWRLPENVASNKGLRREVFGCLFSVSHFISLTFSSKLCSSSGSNSVVVSSSLADPFLCRLDGNSRGTFSFSLICLLDGRRMCFSRSLIFIFHEP